MRCHTTMLYPPITRQYSERREKSRTSSCVHSLPGCSRSFVDGSGASFPRTTRTQIMTRKPGRMGAFPRADLGACVAVGLWIPTKLLLRAE
ncbi:hypothetical protein BD309DRAFT_974003 [Dichomitus squalens]|uniref:Uncharacterized protein n=1 Tax=Dichomitus squalens TaxID=114155 RepID=A0A4V2K2P3_9APHY|nr:hypothetical protein BD309DRAFT_974003 [Dichomitus squalens]TBU59437.1 hypothetical protein BD310DRAFT_925120 [Dichomitus squalens]